MKLSKLTAMTVLATLPVASLLPAQAPAGEEAAPPQIQVEQQQPAGEQLSPERMLEIYGYIVGLQSGIRDFDLDDEEFEALLKGLRSAHAGDPMPENLEQQFPQLQVYLSQRQSEVVGKRSAEHREEAEEFFAELQEKEDIQRTEEGLYYEIERQGDGERPEADDTVRVHYEGRLIDGTVFDSSRERGEPVDFPVSGVIPGMTIGLQLLQEGGRAKFYIPPDLGYGDESPQPRIPPGSALIFDVELIEITEGEQEPALQQFQPQPQK